jgi:hypothetical protein
MQQKAKHRGTAGWTLPEGVTRYKALDVIAAYDAYATLKGAREAYEKLYPGETLKEMQIKGILNHRDVLGAPEPDPSAYYRKKMKQFMGDITGSWTEIAALAAKRTLDGLKDPESAISKKQAPVILGIATDKLAPLMEKMGVYGDSEQKTLSVEEAKQLLAQAKGLDIVDVEPEEAKDGEE